MSRGSFEHKYRVSRHRPFLRIEQTMTDFTSKKDFGDIVYVLALLWVPLAIYALLCLRSKVTSAPSLGVSKNR